MNKLYFLLLVFLLPLPAMGASDTGNPQTDALLDSARTYILADNTKASLFTTELEKVAKRRNNQTALAYAFLFYGVIDEAHGDTDHALRNFRTAQRHAARSSDKVVGLRIQLALSNYYMNLSDFGSCIAVCHRGIRQANAIGNREIASQFYNNLSLCHSYMGNVDKALEYNTKSIGLKKDLDDENGLANAYLNRGLLLTEAGRYEDGFGYYDKAGALYRKGGNYTALTQLYINFGWDYADLKDFARSREYLDKAMVFSKKSGDKIREAGVWNAWGHYYRAKGMTDSLTHVLETGYRLSMEAKNLRSALTASRELSEHYRQTGDLEKALLYMSRSQEIGDSVMNESRLETGQALNARFDARQKELTISEQNARLAQRTMWIVVVIAVAVLLIASLLVIQYRRRVNARKAEARRIDLAAYESEQNERIRVARELHDGLGQLLSTARLNVAGLEGTVPDEDAFLVDNACKLIDDAVTEVRAISHNMMPVALTQLGLVPAIRELAAKISDSRSLSVSFETDLGARLHPSLEIAVYRVVQEIVNNALKHARASSIIISLTQAKGRLLLKISDDGIGLDANGAKNGGGLGWKSIFSRISMFDGQVDVRSSPGKGTDFVISVPL